MEHQKGTGIIFIKYVKAWLSYLAVTQNITKYIFSVPKGNMAKCHLPSRNTLLSLKAASVEICQTLPVK